MKTTYRDLYEYGRERLEKAQVPDPGTDAWLLLNSVFGITRAQYLLERDIIFTPDLCLQEQYQDLIIQRAKRIPLQYLTGMQEFFGFPVFVDPHVLIPRPETELLVEWVINSSGDQGAGNKNLCVLDLCTGSGCIAIALMRSGRFNCVDGADISDEALAIARKNAEYNHAGVHFYQSDLFERIEKKYDIIVSNPPYISDLEIKDLQPEVRDHEPVLALSGGEDGLSFYRRIAKDAKSRLNHPGKLFMEIGADQGSAVCSLLKKEGFTDIVLKQDYAGLDRMVCGVYLG